MKSLEERLEMLDEILEDKTPDQLFEELMQFEPVGMKVCDFSISEQEVIEIVQSEVDANPDIFFIPISEARKKRNYDKFNTPVGERKYKTI